MSPRSEVISDLKEMVTHPRRYLNGEPWIPILALFALNAVDEFDNVAYDNLGPEISHSFHMSSGAFNSIALIATVLSPIIAVPLAYVGDRRKRMPLAIGAAAVWGAASLATGLASVVWVLVAVRLISGAGKVVNDPVHGALIADFYSPKARVKAFGVRALAPAVGAVVAGPLMGVLAQAYGWRVPFYVATVPTLLLLPFLLKIKEPARNSFEVGEAETAPPWRETFTRLWEIRTLRLTWIGGAFAFGAVAACSRLVPFLLHDRYHVEPGLRGGIAGVGGALAAVAAVAGTAFIQNHLNYSPGEGLRMLCWSGVAAGIAIFVIAAVPTLWVTVAMIVVVLMAYSFVVPGLSAINTLVSPPEMRSSSFALGGLISLAGVAFALVGVLIGNVNQLAAFAVMSPVFLWGVSYFFRAAQHLDNDIARLDPAMRMQAREDHARRAEMLLQARGLTVHYGRVQVLFGVDLDIERGEIVALLGTNGAGKSTALNAISGLHPPTAGNVWFEGHAITAEPPERTVRRGIVQVPGGRGVFPGLSVEENLAMGAFTIRRNRSEVADRMREVYALFPRLDERRAQLAGSLSGGERQMLTLAQSFLLSPKLLIIDELSLGLAPAIVAELLDAVRGMNAHGTSILIVEQSVNVALTLAHRAYFMEKGEVRFSGPTAELLGREDLLRSVFLEGAKAGV